VRVRRGVVLATLLGVAGCAAPVPLASYRGPRTDHFDGEYFHNIEPFAEQRVVDVVRWQTNRAPGAWPESAIVPAPPPPERVSGGAIRVTFINHATVLIQMDGLNILTDPVYSGVIGPVEWAGLRRHWPPGVRFDDLPPIDVVLVSHDHYDHLDIPTLRRLVRAFHPRIITGLGNGALLRSQGIPASTELDWWRSARIAEGVRVTSVPAQHWGGRTLTDHCRRLWMGFVIEGRRDTVYFAGDTGWGRFYEMIHARWPRFRLALLPIAPFYPRWYMHRKHMSPADAVRAAQVLLASTTVAIHWGTFEMGDDGRMEPVDSLRAAIGALPARCRPDVRVLVNGESLMVPEVASLDRLIVASDSSCAPIQAESRRHSPT
jgi:L-ascorbate metabolism protein UlaG (beta-lactamase superfamily)